MNELTEQMKQAYTRGGRKEAQQTFLTMAEERDWTKEELRDAAELLRSYPTS